jgi:type IV secretion system protein VirB8
MRCIVLFDITHRRLRRYERHKLGLMMSKNKKVKAVAVANVETVSGLKVKPTPPLTKATPKHAAKKSNTKKQSTQDLFEGANNYQATSVDEANERARKADTRSKYAFLLAGLCVLAVTFLAPLKQVVPYLITLDLDNGQYQVKKLLNEEFKSLDLFAASNKYWINQFMILRETFDASTMNSQYASLQALSEQKVYQQYKDELLDGINGDDSWQERYSNKLVTIDVVSSEPLNQQAETTATEGHYIVRFKKTIKDLQKPTKPREVYYQSIIKFQYNKIPKTDEQIEVNPFGFTVTSYRRNQQDF